jgi:hypothetical protein
MVFLRRFTIARENVCVCRKLTIYRNLWRLRASAGNRWPLKRGKPLRFEDLRGVSLASIVEAY